MIFSNKDIQKTIEDDMVFISINSSLIDVDPNNNIFPLVDEEYDVRGTDDAIVYTVGNHLKGLPEYIALCGTIVNGPVLTIKELIKNVKDASNMLVAFSHRNIKFDCYATVISSNNRQYVTHPIIDSSIVPISVYRGIYQFYNHNDFKMTAFLPSTFIV